MYGDVQSVADTRLINGYSCRLQYVGHHWHAERIFFLHNYI